VIPKLSVDLDTPEGQKAFAEFNTETVKAGYEGIMVKDPESPYETKRTASWLKIKPFIEVSLTVVGFEEGTGKNVGMLGAVIFEGEDDGRFIHVNVGGGFSDEERDEIWVNRDKYMGFIGEVRADVLTQDRNSTDVWSLRFPRFKGWRGTKPGEKL
jgi:DNA ligase-1